MPHIALITDSYPPEIRSASHLMLELAEMLLKRGFDVTVVTSWPQYNLDQNHAVQYQECMNENGITVIRMKHLPHHGVSFIVRGIAQLLLPHLFIRKIKQYVTKKIDIAIVYSPPLPLSFVARYLQKKYRAQFILNVQDLFPQNAIDLGVLNNKLAIAFFRWMEKKSYGYADVITTHSVGNKKILSSYYPQYQKKMHVLHNWVNVDAHSVNTITEDFRKKFSLENKFVIVFAGVIGPSQYLHIIIETAEKLQHHTELCFLLVGDGTEKKKLVAYCAEKKLQNVVFQNFVSRECYSQLLLACNVGLVCLSPKNKTPVVPGKILGYMAAGLPVLAVLNKESDAHALIRDAQCGYTVPSDHIDDIVRMIETAYAQRDQHHNMGQAGLHYAQQHFSREVCVAQLVELFRSPL